MKLSLADQAAIRLGNTFATWTFVCFQMLLIAIWFVWNPFGGAERVGLDLAISIWTLVLDCVILISQRQGAKELQRNTEATAKTAAATADVAERMFAFLQEEKEVHKILQDTQEKILKKLNGTHKHQN